MRPKLTSLLLVILLAPAAAWAWKYAPGDTIIKGGKVVDGTGSPAVTTDVLVRNERVFAIGQLPEPIPPTVTQIDATGKVVAPGFIDTHAHGDPAETPDMHNFLAMGVTTLCLGQDGSSTRVHDDPETTRTEGMKAWFQDVETTVPGPNVLTYIGHGTVRTESGVKLSTAPTELQIQQMAQLVEDALQLGAFGLTTGLEYQPGTFSRAPELAAVAKPVGKRGLTIISHMRNEDDDQLFDAIKELVAQCSSAGANAHISHLKSVYGKGAARAEEILALIDQQRQGGTRVTADIYPYTASHTGLAILFPDWALPPHSYSEVLAARRPELVAYLHERVAKRNGPEATLLSTGEHAGKTLAQLAVERQKPYAEVLADLSPRRGSAAYFVMDEELQNRLLIAEGVNICSDGSPTMRHPRGYGSFARVIRKFVQEDQLLSLEQAIHKMSGLPAQSTTLDQHGRGTIKVGNFADLLIFDPAQVKDTATFEEPHQLSVGFDTILVNGKVIRKDGEFTGERNGHVLRREDK